MNSTCMLFLSMYTLIILTMRLCEQRNSCPKVIILTMRLCEQRNSCPKEVGLNEAARS